MRTRGYQHLIDTHPGNTTSKGPPVNAVSIPKDKARRSIKRKSFDYLLRGPQRCRVRCHIDMKNATTIMPKHKEDIQNPKLSLA